jgi:hypothetical protein
MIIILALVRWNGRVDCRGGKPYSARAQTRHSKAVDGTKAIRVMSLIGVKIQPKFTVPFVRDPKFVGREDIMQEITNRLEIQRRVSLCGIGGIR